MTAPGVPGPGPVVRSNPLVLVAILLFASVLLTGSLTWNLWPGEARLTAPLLCPDDRPDALVVARHERVVSATATDLTMVCVGPRGQVTDVGFLLPTLVLWVAHAVAMGAVLLLGIGALVLRSRVARRRRRDRLGPPATAPPPPA
ncbi:hypothetical protein [Euzebya sp.]|uniref:hypothetical protein n=1 Tax=Euzebya sp. TaxID=1971409 RepID=UPI0035177F70